MSAGSDTRRVTGGSPGPASGVAVPVAAVASGPGSLGVGSPAALVDGVDSAPDVCGAGGSSAGVLLQPAEVASTPTSNQPTDARGTTRQGYGPPVGHQVMATDDDER